MRPRLAPAETNFDMPVGILSRIFGRTIFTSSASRADIPITRGHNDDYDYRYAARVFAPARRR